MRRLGKFLSRFVDPVQLMTNEDLHEIYASMRVRRQKTQAQAKVCVDVKRRIRLEMKRRGLSHVVSLIDRDSVDPFSDYVDRDY